MRMHPKTQIAAGSAIVFLAVAVAILAPVLSLHDPESLSFEKRFTPPIFMPGGSPSVPLGTDHLGRDMWTRILFGLRTSLIIALGSLAIGAAIGILAGIALGHYPAPWDDLFNADAYFPVSLLIQAGWLFITVFFALLLIAIFGTGTGTLTVIVGLTTWPRYVKVIRHRAITLMTAASIGRASQSGLSEYATGIRESIRQMASILPGLLVSQMGFLIAVEFVLTFLGVGVFPSLPSLGGMVSTGWEYQSTGWWILVFPLFALILLVAGFWMLGDGLNHRSASKSEAPR